MPTGAEQVTNERVFSQMDRDHSELSACQHAVAPRSCQAPTEAAEAAMPRVLQPPRYAWPPRREEYDVQSHIYCLPSRGPTRGVFVNIQRDLAHSIKRRRAQREGGTLSELALLRHGRWRTWGCSHDHAIQSLQSERRP
jgi:hypothetical protein